MVKVAVACMLGELELVAVMVTVWLVEPAPVGAVYKPLWLIDPGPESDQVTELLIYQPIA